MKPRNYLNSNSDFTGSAWVATPEMATANIWLWMPAVYPGLPISQDSEYSLQERGFQRVNNSFLEWIFWNQDSIVIHCTTPQLDQFQAWAPQDDISRIMKIPVALGFSAPSEMAAQAKDTPSEAKVILVHARNTPPTNWGEQAIILSGDEPDGLFYTSIHDLGKKSQELQRQIAHTLTSYEPPHETPYALPKETRRKVRVLAADYWKFYLANHRIERPRAIDLFTTRDYNFAPLTMIQDGAHASIYHKDEWDQKRMIHQEGAYKGIQLSSYHFTHTSGKTTYWMQRPEDTEAPIDPDRVSEEMLRQQQELSDWEADLVTLAPAYLLVTKQEEVALSPEQLLRDLGYQPKHNQAGYGNGYRPEELQRIIDAFERLALLQIKTGQEIRHSRGRKPSLVTAESPYLIITERLWQEPTAASDSRRLLGWKYQITWLKQFSGGTEAGRQFGVLLKKSFSYSQNQRWEKRLARYLTIHLCVAAHHGDAGINCTIRRVLEQCGLAPTTRDRSRPAEYKKRFEEVMGHLKKDGLVGDWKLTIDEKSLPARHWLDLWLDSTFRVTQAPTALEAGYQKMIDDAQERKARRQTSLPDNSSRRNPGRMSSQPR